MVVPAGGMASLCSSHLQGKTRHGASRVAPQTEWGWGSDALLSTDTHPADRGKPQLCVAKPGLTWLSPSRSLLCCALLPSTAQAASIPQHNWQLLVFERFGMELAWNVPITPHHAVRVRTPVLFICRASVPFALLNASVAASQVVAAPLAAALLRLDGVAGLAGWQ